MEIHHDKHHAAYVTNLNKAIEGTALDNQPIDELLRNIDKVPENIRTAVRNNGGGHANHSMFWTTMGPGKGGKPSGKLAEAIKANWAASSLQEDFTAAAAAASAAAGPGSAVDKNKKLVVESTPNQDSPLMHGNTPILGIDVWEHAYYLQLSEPPSRLHRRVFQRDRLGRRRQTVRGSHRLAGNQARTPRLGVGTLECTL